MPIAIPLAKNGHIISGNSPLLSNKKEDFIQYANLCQLRSYNNKYLLRSEQAALKQAEILLAELKDKYHLK